ncbi:MAG: VWA domain-containing protein [Candidatus Pacebacteria bacterium]|nr:VWA domain-containing protein [Candidatus Paceibacterota bacterium]
MKESIVKTCLLATLVLTSTALACRIIVPPPWPPHPIPVPEPRVEPMEVKSHEAIIDIQRHHVSVHVTAVFHNPNPRRIEGAYVFPIPRDAAVSAFSMTMNGKTVEGELLEADKARGIYEDIVRKLKDPALLEYIDDGLIRARVFPIEPNKDVKIQLDYEQVIERDGDLSRFVYPLLAAKPGGNNSIGQLKLTVNLRAATAIKTVLCPAFNVDVQRPDDTSAVVTYEASHYTPDKDFEIIFSADKAPVGVDFLTYKEGDDGYFLMTAAPRSELQTEELGAKEIVFVFDTSGSMMGDKIKQARQALMFCIENLNKTDTFNIVSFSTDLEPFAEQPVPADDEHREKAKAFVADFKPRGGTAIDKALSFTMDMPVDQDRPSMVVFLTDGLPTIGVVEPEKILEHVKKDGKRRVFTFGVGYDVNTRLLDGIAGNTGGAPSYVRPEENLELSLTHFYNRIAYPVMTDLRLNSGGARLAKQHPEELPDMFKGSQIVVVGKFQGAGNADMVLSGVINDVREKCPFTADLGGDVRNAFIPRMWAVRRVGYLQEQIQLHGKSDELIDEIKRLGRKYGILTPYTSFLIVEQGVAQDRLEDARRAFHEAEETASADAVGRGAVDAARMRQSMKAGQAPAGWNALSSLRSASERAGITQDSLEDLVTQAHDKTFYFRRGNGFWYDSEIGADEDPKADIEVKAWSDAFFDLLKEYPALKRYLKAGAKIVVKLDGKIVRITE